MWGREEISLQSTLHILAHLLTAPQLLLSRYIGLDCRADRMARREEKFRSSLQRWGGGGGGGGVEAMVRP